MEKLFELKMAGIRRLEEKSKCQIPCNQEYFEVNKAFEVSSSLSGDERTGYTVIYARFLYNDRVPQSREEYVYTPYMLLTDIGGIVGLFLGASMWSIAKNLRKFSIKLFRFANE